MFQYFPISSFYVLIFTGAQHLVETHFIEYDFWSNMIFDWKKNVNKTKKVWHVNFPPCATFGQNYSLPYSIMKFDKKTMHYMLAAYSGWLNY